MQPAATTHLNTPLAVVAGLTAPVLKMLAGEGFDTVESLLMYFPARHEDRRRMEFKGFSPSETAVCHHVRIVKTKVLRFGRRGGVFEATVEGAVQNPMHQQLTLRWFNMIYMQRALAVDMELIVYGKIKEGKTRLMMDHPEYEIIAGGEDDEGGAGIHTGRMVPVYRLRGGLKQKPLRVAVWRVLQNFDLSAVPDLLPAPKVGGEFAGLSRGRVIGDFHYPAEQQNLDLARRYLALEEFYIMQLRVLRRRRQFLQHGGTAHLAEGALLGKFVSALPFEFTEAQRRCLEEIRGDMALPSPMNRLLHGDVGSGKTVVALAAALLAIESGYQAALMAPTQILAEQHFQNARKWLEPLGVRVVLRTGERTEDGFTTVDAENPELSLGKSLNPSVLSVSSVVGPQLFIGTHALLYDSVSMPRLGLAVIDEQHKFGVAQRARLIAHGRAPDVLVMTATPIPRTLKLTLYGDLDVSTIDERPKERGKTITAVRTVKKLDEVTKFVLKQIEGGRQCFIVYPLIDESEKLDAGAAKAGFAEWTKKLAPHVVGLMHGRMDGAEKESVMRGFRAGEIKALVSTTVIEVGVDVPNATVMLVFNAERFGLAQIHQLRGRIGRGAHTSYAVLFVPEKDAEAKERLRILEESSDGFVIAEEDLRRRGPGDVLGHAQSGQAPLQFGEMLADTRLLTLARRLAERTLSGDGELKKPGHAALRSLVGEGDAPVGMMQ